MPNKKQLYIKNEKGCSKYTDPNEHPISHLHSVICDINFNIVFDPNPDYQNVLNYPYSRLIGYNGIRGVDTIHKFNIS